MNTQVWKNLHKCLLREWKIALVCFGVIITFFVFFSHVDATPINAQTLLELTNNLREEGGIPKLTVNEKLIAAAKLKAEHVMKYQYWAHNGPGDPSDPNYRTPWDWFKAVGYDYKYAGENMAVDYITSEGVYTGWLNSVSHYNNIMEPKYTELGIYVLPGNFQGNQTTLVVQIFGTPNVITEETPLSVIESTPKNIDIPPVQIQKETPQEKPRVITPISQPVETTVIPQPKIVPTPLGMRESNEAIAQEAIIPKVETPSFPEVRQEIVTPLIEKKTEEIVSVPSYPTPQPVEEVQKISFFQKIMNFFRKIFSL